MFVRVSRKNTGLHFTVVDIQQDVEKEQELDLILDLGFIQHKDLNGVESWYIIAESLIACDLSNDEKRFLARDLANWLPPLSLTGLLKAREEDIRQLAAISQDASPLPADLSENDPLTIIARWLGDG